MTSAAAEAGRDGPDAGRRDTEVGSGRALVPVPQATPGAEASAKAWRFAGLGRSHGLLAGGAALAMGLSFVAGTALFADRTQPVQTARVVPPSADSTMDVLVRLQGEVRGLKAGLDGLRASTDNARQDETIRGLKRSVDTLKGDLEGVKTASTASAGQLVAKLDRLDRDPGPKLAEIAARLDKLDRDPGPKLADMTARLDRMERQVSSADATGSLPPQAVTNAAAFPAAMKAPLPPQRAAAVVPAVPSPGPAVVPPPRPEGVAKADLGKADPAKADPAKAEPGRADVAKVDLARADPGRPDGLVKGDSPSRADPAARPGVVDGWMLRDVYGGVALLEGRGGLREVTPGEYLAGVGEIRSIERRGRGWVVVTSRGIIQADNRW